MSPITDCLKSEAPAATKAFTKVKRMMTEAHVMRLSDFLKVFEVTCDASRIAIGSALSQENYHVAYSARS